MRQRMTFTGQIVTADGTYMNHGVQCVLSREVGFSEWNIDVTVYGMSSDNFQDRREYPTRNCMSTTVEGAKKAALDQIRMRAGGVVHVPADNITFHVDTVWVDSSD